METLINYEEANKLIRFAKYAASRDISRLSINTILFESDIGSITSTDGYMLVQTKLDLVLDVSTIRNAKLFKKSDDVIIVKYDESVRWFTFTNRDKSQMITIRLTTYKFPNYKSVLQTELRQPDSTTTLNLSLFEKVYKALDYDKWKVQIGSSNQHIVLTSFDQKSKALIMPIITT